MRSIVSCFTASIRHAITFGVIHTQAFGKNQLGSIFTYAALAIIPLAGFAGVSLDAARGYMLKSRLSQSLDASSLAAGRSLTQDEMQADVERYFTLNFKDEDGSVTLNGPLVVYNEDTNTITVSASASIGTSFMRLLGHDRLTVSARTTIQRNVRGMELALIMDNTGSMRSNGKMDAMKSSAQDLINILYGDRETIDNFWVSLVPYSASVNIGSNNWAWLTGYNPSAYTNAGTVWKGCVEARSGTFDRSDDPPSVRAFAPYFYPFASDNQFPPLREANNWQDDGRGPNLGCGPAITPLTASKTTIQEGIDLMQPWHRGGTLTNLGLVWGWRTLSPRWRGVWDVDDASLPKDYTEPLMDKVAIILTDGENQFFDYQGGGPDGSDYTAYGRRSWNRLGLANPSSANSTTEVNNRMAAVCTAMKNQGIILYTITFQLNTTSTQNLFRTCATSPAHYFNSPTNAELQNVFRRIGNELSNLRITE